MQQVMEYLQSDHVTAWLKQLQEYARNQRHVMTAGVPVVLLWYLWYKRPRLFPKGPRGVPGLGVIPFLGKLAARDFYKWSKGYGSVMSVRMGPNDLVMLNDIETIRKVSSAFTQALSVS